MSFHRLSKRALGSLICTACRNKFASTAVNQPKDKITTAVSWSYQCSKVPVATLSQKATVVTPALACEGCHILWCRNMLRFHNKTRPRFTKPKLHHCMRTTNYKTSTRKPEPKPYSTRKTRAELSNPPVLSRAEIITAFTAVAIHTNGDTTVHTLIDDRARPLLTVDA